MTLNTHIYLNGPIAPRQAFETAISAVLKAAGREGESALIDPPKDNWRRDGSERLSTTVGQGLPAWTECFYRTDGPLAPDDEYETEDDGEHFLVRPACDIEVTWDTTYGYNDDGLNCTQLHVLALIELRRALPKQIELLWENEYSGNINVEMNGFEEFLSDGSEASNWFASIQSALEDLAKEGGSE